MKKADFDDAIFFDTSKAKIIAGIEKHNHKIGAKVRIILSLFLIL